MMSCWIALNPTVDDIKDFQYCLIAERQVKAVVIWKPLVEKYFEQKDVKKALRIIYCESRGKSTAIGINKDKSKDVGLWQFNVNTWAWLKPKLKITSTRFNAEVSTAVASWLVYNDGWYHWNSSKHCWGK